MQRSQRPRSILHAIERSVATGWLTQEMFERGREFVEQRRVARPALRESSVQTDVADKRRRMRVKIEATDEGLVSRCACGAPSDRCCAHAAALVVLLVGAALPQWMSDATPQSAGAGEGDPVESSVDRERRVRGERGASELFVVRAHPGTVLFGKYEVGSPSARAYDVALRALDAPHNGCSCADFATNLLGTCKHIEAVLCRLEKGSARKLKKARSEDVPASYLYLAFDPQPSVRLRLRQARTAAERRMSARYFNAQGRLLGELEDVWPEMRADAVEAEVEVPQEVERHAERERESRERNRKRLQIEAGVKRAGATQPGFRVSLYPYQVDGVAFLAARSRALLADDMGLGKTAQAICAMVRMFDEGKARRALIVCPASLKHQWERELRRFTHIAEDKIVVVSGSRELRLERYASDFRVIITSYELVRADEEHLVAMAPDLVVLDEAQRIKNWRTRTASAVKRIPSRHAFVLTGTPLENRLDDLYSLMQVVDPHLLGPLYRFNEDFIELDDKNRVKGYRRLDALRERLSSVMLRRRKEQVLTQLPAQIVNRLAVPMTREQSEIHEDALNVVVRLLSVLKKRPLTPIEEKRLMSAFQRMRMACDAAGLVDHETEDAPKLAELAGLLDDICVGEGRKVVVFSEWERMQEMAATLCKKAKIGFVRLHGGVPSAARGALIDRFRDDPDCKVFFSTDAGGVGLNLQVASHVINLDLPWNPAVLAQRIARVHRLGQKDAVNVVLMVSENSFEQRMEGILESKRALFSAVVGDDTQTTSLERSTLAGRIATVLNAAYAASAVAAPAAQPADPVASLRERLGERVERVVKLDDGRLLAVVAGDGPAPELPPESNALVMTSHAAAALTVLGDASPVARAQVLFEQQGDPEDWARALARKGLVSAAERKLAAARALLAAELPADALSLSRDAMSFACRALADRDPGSDPAALLITIYGPMSSSGALSPDEAHAIVQAGELARAFDAAPEGPPRELVSELVARAERLVARAVDGARRAVG